MPVPSGVDMALMAKQRFAQENIRFEGLIGSFHAMW